MKTLIKDATIINEGLKYTGSVLIGDDKIEKVFPHILPADFDLSKIEVIDAKGLYLIPGDSYAITPNEFHNRE